MAAGSSGCGAGGSACRNTHCCTSSCRAFLDKLVIFAVIIEAAEQNAGEALRLCEGLRPLGCRRERRLRGLRLVACELFSDI